jgi:acetyl esterase
VTHPLDDEAREVLDMVAANVPPPPQSLTIEEFRSAAYAALAVSGEPEEMAAVEDTEVTGAQGPLRARRYAPPGKPAGLLVYFHGGGFVRGDLETHDPLCRRLARAAQCELLAIDYRLAPEHPFPAAVDDAVAVVESVAADTAAPLAVGGDSSGGNLAAVAALHARDAGGPALVAQVLLYPVTDATMSSPSLDELATGRMLTRAALEWMYDRYLPAAVDRSDPRASPLLAEDVAGVAPAVIVTAGNDPLRDDGVRYAERLSQAGVYADHLSYGGTIHSFMLYAGALKRGVEAAADAGAALRRLLPMPRNPA